MVLQAAMWRMSLVSIALRDLEQRFPHTTETCSRRGVVFAEDSIQDWADEKVLISVRNMELIRSFRYRYQAIPWPCAHGNEVFGEGKAIGVVLFSSFICYCSTMMNSILENVKLSVLTFCAYSRGCF